MALKWEQVIVDGADPGALGRWWATAHEWVVANDRVLEPKTLKNRLHLAR